MSYWDLDDIMAEQTKLKCNFPEKIKGFANLLEGNVDLPFWIGTA